jgi:hypothetical protein
MIKSDKIDIISTIVIIGFCLAAYFHFIVAGSYLSLDYPINTFLFRPADKFMDFFNQMDLSRDFDPYINNDNHGIVANYFPFTYIVFYCFSFFPKEAALAIFLTIFIVCVFYTVKYFIQDKSSSMTSNIKNIFAISLLTYPFLFLIDRGNIEGMVFVFEAAFLILYLNKKFNLALLFLALATAMKLYPGLLALLFLKDRRYKEFLLCSFLTLTISVLSLWLFKGTLVENINGFLQELGQFNKIYVLSPHPNTNGQSIISLLKILIALFGIKTDTAGFYFLWYIVEFCIMTYGFIFYYIFRFENIVWKQLTILISAGIILFNCSYDYKMISLILPLLVYVKDESESPYDKIYSICFGLLLVPKQIFVNIAPFYDVLISNMINPILMIILIWFIVKERFTKHV